MHSYNEDIKYCQEALPRVSRTFAPTIRILPGKLNLTVNVAYLLCRIADSIEDEPRLDIEQKVCLLNGYINILKTKDKQTVNKFLKDFSRVPNDSNDLDLVYNLERVLNVFYHFPEIVQKHIGRWVIEMSRGMIKFAQAPQKSTFYYLRSMKELDEYTYYVAGTVGHLLTALFYHFSNKINPVIRKKLESMAESFGKGLQMVNIIRDMASDLRRGQSYIPDEILNKYHLTRKTIFNAENTLQAQKLFNELIETAVLHLDNALGYTVTIPKRETRIRIFCLLPLFWAMRTLQVIQANTLMLLGKDKIKISRWVIKTEFLKVFLLTFSNRLTIRHYTKMRRELDRSALIHANA